MTSLVLYFAPGSSSMAVHIALNEIGVPFEARPLSFARGETRTPAFLAINPAGKVPTLLIDGRPLTEVAGCLFYLARRYPEARLLPDDDETQAQAVSWMSFIASTLHPARRMGLAHASEVWQIAERRLGTNEWALGAFSIVDIHLFRLFWRMARSLGPAAGKFGILFAHHDRMSARPAVQRTIEVEAAIGYELPS
ncbi:glutathione S-transferase family protein [Reyranella sp.]|jgi:glutathione S-transferase|uniref:glutathione S-transferase family protein n=1 Tax=Reyranella sp. TaxID=1929291 RepID=UPI002F95E3EA